MRLFKGLFTDWCSSANMNNYSRGFKLGDGLWNERSGQMDQSVNLEKSTFGLRLIVNERRNPKACCDDCW